MLTMPIRVRYHFRWIQYLENSRWECVFTNQEIIFAIQAWRLQSQCQKRSVHLCTDVYLNISNIFSVISGEITLYIKNLKHSHFYRLLHFQSLIQKKSSFRDLGRW